MQNKRCAMSGEVDRENCGGGGAVTVSRSRTLGKALLLLAASAAMLFGSGGLPVQAEPVTPTSPECEVDDKKVTCKGDLSDGVSVKVEGDTDYTTLVVKDLTGNIATAAEETRGIEFTSDSNEKITLDVDTGGNSITTSGENSQGIRARSTGAVTVDVTSDDITTTGDDSEGIEAYSRGGGAVEVTVTGKITTGFEGSEGIDARSDNGSGPVMVTVTGDITTMGDEDSEGIFARSTGNGAVTVDVTGNITTSGGCYDESSDFDANCSEGIHARANGDGAVKVTVKGHIKTSGDKSEGIDAESEEDGAVTVDVTGDIETEGDDSQGIDAYSKGGDVTVTVTGKITTKRDGSQGIDAVSEGDGNVEVSVTGDIKTERTNSEGIYAEAVNGAISITLNGGTIASDQGVGVQFDGGAANTLTISRGAAVTISGSANDVQGGDNNETIDNWGTLTTRGTIDLGDGTNTFENQVGATFNSGTSVALGTNTTDVFFNAGDLSPGGAGLVQTTEIGGNFQNVISEEMRGSEDILRKGIYTVTLDADGTSSDRLKVTRFATLGGTVRVAGAYAGTYTILESSEISGEDRFDAMIDTLFMDYELSYEDDEDDVGSEIDHVVLTSTRREDVSFLQFAGTANQQSMANALDSLEDTDVSNAIIQAGRSITDPQQLQAAMDAISGEVHASLKGALLDTGQRPVAAVHRRLTARGSQPDARTSTAAVGDLSSRADGESGFWMIGYDAWSQTKATANTAQMDTDLGGGLFGIDRALGKRGYVGLLGGYSQTSVAQRARVSSGSVETWSVGLYGGAEVGASRLRFGALYNGHSVTTRRTVGFPSEQRLSARYDAWSWQVFSETGYQLQVRELRLEPFAGVSHIRLETDGFSETGGNAARTASSDTNSRTLTTLGVRSAMEVKDMVQARGMVGWRHAFGDTDPSASTLRLSNSDPVTVLGAPTAQDAVVTEFGLEVGLSAHAVIGVAYQGQYGDGVTVHGFNAGLKVTF